MASRYNQMFQLSPEAYLGRHVLFTDNLLVPENQTVHAMDIEPIVTNINTRTRLRILEGLHQYEDMHMMSYLIPMDGVALIPKNDPPHRLVFIPDFTCCRLLVKGDEALLRLSVQRGLKEKLPPPEGCVDSYDYWETVTSELIGRVRGTAVLYKERGDGPWQFVMQQIVGPPGAELVRKTFSRPLRY